MPSTPRDSPQRPGASGAATRAALVIDQVTHGYVLLDDAIVELADADGANASAMLIAERIGLQPDTVERAFEAQSEDPVMLMCRAAGLNINGYSAVLRMRRRRQQGTDPNPSAALASFRQTPLETAQRVIRMLKVNEARS